jgi:ribosomal protein RSM22 (predicted rRNA methylase)
VPATYAQIAGALYQIKKTMPEWEPESVLDLGSGPGTALWAAKEVWPSLKKATAIDNDGSFLSVSRELFHRSDLELEVEWEGDSLRSDFGSKNNKYDVVILANVLNELTEEERIKVVDRAFTQCSKVLVIIEPGTPAGAQIITDIYTSFTNKNFLLAPFINNTFVDTKNFWLHFPQRFIRPEFQRRIRQHMRVSSLMASDWEETKYSYITFSKYPAELNAWGRVVAPIKKQKAWFDLTVLTAKGIEKLQVFKRNKEKYNLVRKLRWGDVIEDKL